MSDKMKPGDLEAPQAQPASVHNATVDAVFGEITEDGPNYRGLGWIATVILMTKTMIGLGSLSLPKALGVLGLVPGAICLLAIAVIATWSMYIVGTFKMNHREVYAIDDVGYKLFGVFGKNFLGASFCIYWILVSGSGILSISIALNAISTHGTCTAVFVAISAVLAFALSSIRTLGRISWIAWVGLASILSAFVIVTVAVAVQDQPADAPQDRPWKPDYKLFKKPAFHEAVAAISSIVFAYAGTTAFFAIVAEMREPKYYTRSLLICQSIVTATFLSVAIVIYYYCGSYVASPALGSAGPLVKKVAYGIGIPGITVSTVILTHLPSKYIFVRLLRGSRHLAANSPQHWATWLSCTFGATIIAYIIASAIPVFNSLVSLVGALFGTLMSFQPMGCMWLYDNWSRDKRRRSPSWYLMVCWSIFVILAGFFLMVAGTYGSIVQIIIDYNSSGGQSAWSCADNSNSV